MRPDRPIENRQNQLPALRLQHGLQSTTYRQMMTILLTKLADWR